VWTSAIAVAAAGVVAVAVRLVTAADLSYWWTAPALLAGVLAADFGSGLVHWGADTWGRDDLPVIGPRLLVPFRVHHVNPDDFLRRSFVDTNGDLALLAAPMLGALYLVPVDTPSGSALSLFGLSFCCAAMLTNQIHQWAHMPSPPALVRWLQDAGLLLGRAEHARHHDRPYHARYCITTGWCNRPLDAIGFFRVAEDMITRVTGVRPRQDDRRYEERYGAA
jgi:ubiquitin-conjugating enzyme E2 variant